MIFLWILEVKTKQLRVQIIHNYLSGKIIIFFSKVSRK